MQIRRKKTPIDIISTFVGFILLLQGIILSFRMFSFSKKATKVCAILFMVLLRKYQNHKEDGANFCGLHRKAEQQQFSFIFHSLFLTHCSVLCQKFGGNKNKSLLAICKMSIRKTTKDYQKVSVRQKCKEKLKGLHVAIWRKKRFMSFSERAFLRFKRKPK